MEQPKRAWVAATLDTKSDRTNYVCTLLEAAGARNMADLPHPDSVPAGTRIHFRQKTSRITQSGSAVFTADRG
jgi:uncharacterized protein (UPF0261 family)